MGSDDPGPPLIEAAFARPNDAWLGVHVLSQFVFCPRAGVIEWEKNQQDPGMEEDLTPRANLDYMPRYDLTEIHRDIDRTVGRLLWFTPFPITAVVGTLVCWERYGPWAASLGFVLTVLLWWPVLVLGHRLWELRRLLAYALSRPPRVPDPNLRENQRVDWWELLNAGFRSHRFAERMDHPELRLSGNPWRVLMLGDLRIPVFKDRRVTGEEDAKLYRKHYARMTAYCHLLERSMGGESPYGIVLFGDSFVGTAIAKDARGSWAAFTKGIVTARRAIAELKEVSPSPAKPQLCSGCPHGKPFTTTAPPRDKTYVLPVFGVQGADGRTYHSTCGDRFLWVPPHEKASQKSLRM